MRLFAVALIVLLFAAPAFAQTADDSHCSLCDANNLVSHGEPQKAEPIYRKLAEQGSAPAMFKLGAMYEQGNGVKVNYAEALKWYRMAAEVGDGVAMNKVGDFYREGLGVAANFAVAQQWYDRARATGGDDAPVQRPNDRTTYEGSGGE